MFSARAGKGFLREATVVDISRDGLQLHTYDAPTPGTLVEVELQPRKSDPSKLVTLVRGRVARVTRLENGQSAAGIRIHMAPLEPPVVLTTVPSAADEAAGGASSSDATAAAAEVTRAADGDALLCNSVSRGKRRWRWATAAALALLLLLLLRSVYAPGDKHARANTAHAPDKPVAAALSGAVPLGAPSIPARAHTRAPRADSMIRPLVRADSVPRGAAPRVTNMPISSADSRPAPVNAPNPSPVTPEAASAGSFESVPDLSGLGSIERLLAQVDRAQMALALGRKEEARQLLNGAAEFAVDSPDVWKKYADVLTDFSNADGAAIELPAFADAIIVETDKSAAPPNSGVWIDVDKANYVLTVMNHDRPLRRFPVGLGVNNATPSGNYRVANKLTNPDWYNRGETVPAGDPRNPLGKHWMGLGNERGAPTSYGIHSISHPSDLGQPVGRGCIRMIPSDAAALFRLCPIGTPVRIHP